MEFAGMESLEDTPSNITLPPHESDHKEKTNFLTETVGKFVEKFVMVEFDVEKVWHEKQRQRKKIEATAKETSGLPKFRPGKYIVEDFFH